MQQTSQAATAFGKGAGGERQSEAEYGSDVIVELLRELDIPYVALNPGASYRGLHDSFVNFGSSRSPEIVLCCHEEIAVAIAGGYSRVTGRPMAAALHDVVGLQHASMAIFCAYCDRVPMLILGGTGPMDSTKRRPHIDWVHTALVQGNQVRDYTKWDDQPASVAALPESILRGYRIATTEPHGPVYLCFDTEVQEQALTAPMMLPDVSRFAPPAAPAANPAALREAAVLLANARFPLIIADNLGRHRESLQPLQDLAELLGAGVIDQGGKFNFPNTHPLDVTPASGEAIREADVILALDIYDWGDASSGVKDRGTLPSSLQSPATVIHITLGDLLQRAWVSDFERLRPVDVPIAADTAQALPELLSLVRAELGGSSGDRIAQRRVHVQEMHDAARSRALARLEPDRDLRPITPYRLYTELWPLIKDIPWTLEGAAGRMSARTVWDYTEPEQVVGAGRGGGVGYGTGVALGAALAYKGSDRLCMGILGDGEVLMTNSALWTAANSQIPVLLIVFNNQSYYNDEGHQEYIARLRNRPVENKGIGIQIKAPETDFAGLARSMGVAGFGPVTDPDALHSTFEQAIRIVREQKRPVLVDVITQSR